MAEFLNFPKKENAEARLKQRDERARKVVEEFEATQSDHEAALLKYPTLKDLEMKDLIYSFDVQEANTDHKADYLYAIAKHYLKKRESAS